MSEFWMGDSDAFSRPAVTGGMDMTTISVSGETSCTAEVNSWYCLSMVSLESHAMPLLPSITYTYLGCACSMPSRIGILPYSVATVSVITRVIFSPMVA